MYSLNLRDHLEEFWSYVDHGLQSFNNPKTAKAALHCVGDFGRIFKDYFYEREVKLMHKMIEMIHDVNLQR